MTIAIDDTATPPPTKVRILSSAWPPTHSQLLVASLAAVFLWTFPSLESIDEVATVETFTHVLFPEYLSVQSLAYIRLALAMVPFSTTIYQILFHE